MAITSSLSESPGEDSDEFRVLVAVVMVSPPAAPQHSTLSRPGRPEPEGPERKCILVQMQVVQYIDFYIFCIFLHISAYFLHVRLL